MSLQLLEQDESPELRVLCLAEGFPHESLQGFLCTLAFMTMQPAGGCGHHKLSDHSKVWYLSLGM